MGAPSNINPRDFYDDRKLRARITPTHLIVFRTSLLPAEYPLQDIAAVKSYRLPGGQTAMAMEMSEEAHIESPGIIFLDQDNADFFREELLHALTRLQG